MKIVLALVAVFAVICVSFNENFGKNGIET